MLKEMMFKIFPKLLAKAISDEQEHNQKQQEEISVLQTYANRLQNNFSKYSPQIEATMADSEDTEIVEAFTVPEDGIYSIVMTARFQVTGAGYISMIIYRNKSYFAVTSVNFDETYKDINYLHINGLGQFNKGDVIDIVGYQKHFTSCVSNAGFSGMTIQRLN